MITWLRFVGAKDVYFADVPISHGLEILDVRNRQLEGVAVQVSNFENGPDQVRLLARDVVRVDQPEPCPESDSRPMSTALATVLDGSTNRAVVKMSTRSFPGVLLQGDSLKAIHDDLAEAAAAICGRELESASEVLRDVLQRLGDLLDHYESVLDRAGLELPYPREQR